MKSWRPVVATDLTASGYEPASTPASPHISSTHGYGPDIPVLFLHSAWTIVIRISSIRLSSSALGTDDTLTNHKRIYHIANTIQLCLFRSSIFILFSVSSSTSSYSSPFIRPTSSSILHPIPLSHHLTPVSYSICSAPTAPHAFHVRRNNQPRLVSIALYKMNLA